MVCSRDQREGRESTGDPGECGSTRGKHSEKALPSKTPRAVGSVAAEVRLKQLALASKGKPTDE